MAIEEIHVGDVGTALIVLFHESDGSIKDISGATLLQIKLWKPTEGPVVINTATFVDDGTDGYAQYITTATSELDVAGWWWIQGYLEEGILKHHSNRVRFQVFPNLT